MASRARRHGQQSDGIKPQSIGSWRDRVCRLEGTESTCRQGDVEVWPGCLRRRCQRPRRPSTRWSTGEL